MIKSCSLQVWKDPPNYALPFNFLTYMYICSRCFWDQITLSCTIWTSLYSIIKVQCSCFISLCWGLKVQKRWEVVKKTMYNYGNRSFRQRVSSPTTTSPTYEVILPTSNVSSPKPLNYRIQGHFCPCTHISYSSFFNPLTSQTNG